MKSILKSEIGRGVTGIIISVAITLVVLFPVLLMELFSILMPMG